MEKIIINEHSPRFTDNMKEGISKGLTVVCAQRPFPADKTWTQDSFGNGMFFGYGKFEEREKTWSDLDCKMIVTISNKEVVHEIKELCKREGASFDEVTSHTPLRELAEILNLPYMEEEIE